MYDVKQIVDNLERRNVPESSIAPLPTLPCRRGGGAASSADTPDTALIVPPEVLATLTQLQQENALLRQEADKAQSLPAAAEAAALASQSQKLAQTRKAEDALVAKQCAEQQKQQARKKQRKAESDAVKAEANASRVVLEVIADREATTEKAVQAAVVATRAEEQQSRHKLQQNHHARLQRAKQAQQHLKQQVIDATAAQHRANSGAAFAYKTRERIELQLSVAEQRVTSAEKSAANYSARLWREIKERKRRQKAARTRHSKSTYKNRARKENNTRQQLAECQRKMKVVTRTFIKDRKSNRPRSQFRFPARLAYCRINLEGNMASGRVQVTKKHVNTLFRAHARAHTHIHIHRGSRAGLMDF